MATTNGNGFTAVQNGITATLDRIGDIAVARPATYVAQRMEERTAALSERQRFEATAALLNAALSRYTTLVFEPMDDGTPAGVDPVSGFVRIKAPWTTNSHKSYGLRRQEQIVMAAYMQHWQRSTRGAPPLFEYNPTCNRWAANLVAYPDLRAALNVLQVGVFTADLVAKIERHERARDARRRRK
jgi:hypothetical protein